jgi:hypothetical protein
VDGTAGTAFSLALGANFALAVRAPLCSDRIDNDGDGAIDHPADPGCSDTDSLVEDPECQDGTDNDQDGSIDDPADSGCYAPDDRTEVAEQCSNGVDDDDDGLTDHPNDPFCEGFADPEEAARYADGESHELTGSFPGESVFVESFLCGLGYARTPCPTEFRLVEGGSIGALSVEGSIAEIAGGTVVGDLTASGSRVRVASGLIVGSLEASGAVEVELVGGVLQGSIRAIGDELVPLPFPFSPRMEIAGVEIGGDVELRGFAQATISGGVIGGDLEAWGNSSVVVTGGQLLGDLFALDESVVELNGSGFNQGTGEMTEVTGRITGMLEDGTPFDVGFFRAAAATLLLIPEPSPVTTGLVAIGALAGMSHARRKL